MVGLFLLVLLADVARAGTLASADASRGLIRSAATQVRVSPEDGSFEVILTRGKRRPIRFASQNRDLAEELLSNYRSALLQSCGSQAGVSQVGAMRGLFERLCSESGSTLAGLNFGGSGFAFDQRLTAELPSLLVIEHVGSPAP
jgi:hypothetical protein